MFGSEGTVYVYRSYGIHWCVNIVTCPVGTPAAILIRGGKVVAGVDAASRRRGRKDHLADGPGKLCQALSIDGSMTGSRLNTGAIEFTLGNHGSPKFEASPRIGITRATDKLWRFSIPADR